MVQALITTILLFTCLLVSSQKVSAEESLTIKISNIPPWILTDGDGCDTGMICQIFKLYQKESGLKFKYKVTSLARANKAIYDGQQDIALSSELDTLDTM